MPQRSILVQTLYNLEDGQDPQTFDWSNGGCLSFEVYEGYNAWCGTLQQEYRKDWPHDGVQIDLSRFNELVKLHRPVPKDMIYPVFPKEGLTEYTLQPATDDKAVYLKAPKLCDYQDNRDDVAVCLLNETRAHEKIRDSPHSNLVSYLGCVVEGGCIVRLAMNRYPKSLFRQLRSIYTR
ncbi:hypothetical protein LX32DRAFT_397077 [Colletotrichum zoysiae]|uniref:Uncharacterized protein n=1 Tax=Colletotrichum zoysiae TaxID=1216348 RepID=A0AAD9HSJ0_9PEZI|nr:hypothetical protein LX32DRAFT_397077 [Colletotrichum zoysiae]